MTVPGPTVVRPRVMGIVNVTPDSFSDGGRFADTRRAVEHGRALLAQGADILDIGGESTRPGATRPLVAEELDRVVPVITELADSGAPISVDTMRAEVAEAALAAGASIVNDVSGGLADPRILEVVGASEAAYVAMHWRGHSDTMQSRTDYAEGVVAGVIDELGPRLGSFVRAGIPMERIILDPGLGFAKTEEHNWQLLAGLEALQGFGLPLLVGASRKKFLGTLLADADGEPRPVDERESAHTAIVTMLAERGVWGVRVHDVRAACDALAAWQAWRTHE